MSTPEAALAALLRTAMWAERMIAPGIAGAQYVGAEMDAAAEKIAARLLASGVRVSPGEGRAVVIAEIRAGVDRLPTWDKRTVPGGIHVNRAAVLALLDRLEGKS